LRIQHRLPGTRCHNASGFNGTTASQLCESDHQVPQRLRSIYVG
jgi:hypothetical protein